MSYKQDVLTAGPNGIERLLEDRHVWLLLSFTLAIDIACSLYLKTPLISLNFETMEQGLPIGALLVFLCGYGVLVMLTLPVRLRFLEIANIFSKIITKIRTFFDLVVARQTVNQKEKTLIQKYRYKHRENLREYVSVSDLRAYAIEHDHKVCFQLLQEHLSGEKTSWWKYRLVFFTGSLLFIYPWLPTSSLHVYGLGKFAYSEWPVWVISIAIMTWGTYGYDTADVYVGKKAAAINEPRFKQLDKLEEEEKKFNEQLPGLSQ